MVYFHLPILVLVCFNTLVFIVTVVSLCRGYKRNHRALSNKRVMENLRYLWPWQRHKAGPIVGTLSTKVTLSLKV
jgi:hypothetical protein